MPTITENILTIKNSVARMKEALNLPSNTPLENLTVVVESGAGSGGGSVAKSNIYKVTTIAERDAITDMVQNDMCVVISGGLNNMSSSDTPSTLTFPATVILPNAFTGSGWLSLRDENRTKDVMIMLEQTMFRCDIMGDDYISVEYTSTDGITYTRTDSNAETIDLGVEVKCEQAEEWDDTFGYFLQIDGTIFDGIFTYNGTSWEYSNINVGSKETDILNGKVAYTNNGLITGNLLGVADVNSITLVEDYIRNINTYSSTQTDFSNMYSKSPYTELITLPYLNTASAKNMYSMFSVFTGTTLDLSHFDFTNVENLEYFLNGCKSLTNLILPTSNLPTSKLTKLNYFMSYSKLTELDLSGWDTSNVVSMYRPFGYNEVLKKINLSSWTIENCNTMQYFFEGCKALEHIDIRNMEFTKAPLTSYTGIFNSVPSACLIIVKNETEKNWILTKQRSNFTNIKTVAEYGG